MNNIMPAWNIYEALTITYIFESSTQKMICVQHREKEKDVML